MFLCGRSVVLFDAKARRLEDLVGCAFDEDNFDSFDDRDADAGVEFSPNGAFFVADEERAVPFGLPFGFRDSALLFDRRRFLDKGPAMVLSFVSAFYEW